MFNIIFLFNFLKYLIDFVKLISFKSLNPILGGLFCEKIFGPLVSFECICKNFKRKYRRRKNKNKLLFCPKCNVQLISSNIRRYRMGYCEFYR
jgi:DNA-directed RNA polymerase subunit beta'